MEGKLSHEFFLLPPCLGVFLLLNWVSRQKIILTQEKKLKIKIKLLDKNLVKNNG